jgi:arylsulfatase A-like enzyme
MRLTKVLFCCLYLGFILAAGVNAAPSQPNIIVVMADDMGFSDLGCYGSEIETPHIDALASGGLRFSQFYNAGRCCPTRAALLTGLYQHQAGIGAMVSPSGSGAYLGRLNDHCVTLAEALRRAGYMTAMSGKWHVGSAREHWPDRRGFDRFYGTPEGGGHHYGMLPDRTLVSDGKAIDVPQGWYSTTAFTDHAIRYIDEATAADKPLFLYVAYTAPHWPLQAPDETIAEFHDRYRDGWREIRVARLKRQIELGLFANGTELSPHDAKMPKWSTVDQEEMSLRMATHAAMVHLIDAGLGRITDRLRHHGELNNTLILFLSDNGASAESNATGFTGNRGGDPEARTGTPTSYNSFGISGANLCDTPFRLYKKYAHEGGIATPLIAHWPHGIPQKLWGEWSRELGHVIDFMPTFLEIAGADYPKRRGDRETIPMEGRSLLPALHGGEIGRSSGLFFEHFGNAAIRLGQWKLVRSRGQPWSLYDISNDRTELHDVSKDQPTIAVDLKTKWNAWATRVGVEKDLVTPDMTDAAPAAGKRVRQVAAEYKQTDVYHSLYLPVDWKPQGKYPVIVEYTGNKFPPGKGSGEVKDANLGYGVSGGKGFIWVVMPYVEKGRQENAVTWWGDRQATVDYCKVNLPRICGQFGGDPNNVFVCGFSRGAIGASYIGLADDEIASLWKGMFTHDHFDGQKTWAYPESDRASALTRLARLKGRPVLVGGQHASDVRDQYLKDHLELAQFRFLDVPTSEIFRIPEGQVIHAHTDLWMHRDSPYRQQARAWLQDVLKEKRYQN